jgi:hypothetical protein
MPTFLKDGQYQGADYGISFTTSTRALLLQQEDIRPPLGSRRQPYIRAPGLAGAVLHDPGPSPAI